MRRPRGDRATVPSPPVAGPPIALWALEPRPIGCPHDRSGQRHRSLKEVARCLGRYGVPGFRVVLMEVGERSDAEPSDRRPALAATEDSILRRNDGNDPPAHFRDRPLATPSPISDGRESVEYI